MSCNAMSWLEHMHINVACVQWVYMSCDYRLQDLLRILNRTLCLITVTARPD